MWIALIGYRDVQVLDKCQLGDEVRKKEGKLDSTGYLHLPLQHKVF